MSCSTDSKTARSPAKKAFPKKAASGCPSLTNTASTSYYQPISTAIATAAISATSSAIVAGSVQYPGLWKNHSLDEYAAPQPETENYLVMEASDAALTFTGYLPSGEELHTVSIQK